MIRSAIFDGAGQPFRFVNSAKPGFAAGEALVRVSLATICGSDLHTVVGKRNEPTPCVLGHEAVGIVEEVAGVVRTVNGESVKSGDRVVWSVAASCGTCFFCKRGLPQKCETLKKYGHVRLNESRGPSGNFASHVHLWPGTPLVRVPKQVPDSVAAPASCATATVAACLRQFEPDESLLVLGCGLLGLTACAMSRAKGLFPFAVDADEGRCGLAREFGAADAGNLAKIASVIPARGVDAILEFTGSTELTMAALPHLRIGGTLVLAGAVFPTPPLTLLPEQIIRFWLTIRGVHNYAPQDLQTAVDFLAKNCNQYPFEKLVSKTFSLDEMGTAADFALSQKPIRVGIAPTSNL